MIYFFFSTSITPSVIRFTIIGVFSFRKPSVDLTSTISPFISAYPIRARRVVVTPVSPIFTFSSALRSIFEVIFFFIPHETWLCFMSKWTKSTNRSCCFSKPFKGNTVSYDFSCGITKKSFCFIDFLNRNFHVIPPLSRNQKHYINDYRRNHCGLEQIFQYYIFVQHNYRPI